MNCWSWILPACLTAGVVAAAVDAPAPDLSIESWRKGLASRGVDPDKVVHPFVAAEPLAEAARTAAGSGPPLQQLRNLQRFLFNRKEFTFDYDSRLTLTANEAFEKRSGNCVSFTNLFIAMGRSVGIPVQAALAYSARGEGEQIESLVLVDSHVVAAYRDGGDRTIFDFDQARTEAFVGYKLVDDLTLTAIVLNNHAVERLVEDEVEKARQMLEDAVKLAPEMVEVYANLGVAHRRLGDTEAALDAYLLALTLDPGNLPLRNNLRQLYGLLAEARSEGAYADLPEEVRELLQRGDNQFALGVPTEALKTYRAAARRSPDHAEPQVAVARVLIFKGRARQARKRLERALELAPEHVEARRLRDALKGG